MFRKITLILSSVIFVSGCVASEKVDASATPSEVSSAPASAALAPVKVAGVSVSGSLDAEPVIEIGADAMPVTNLEIADQVVGAGESVVPTSTVLAHYVGVGLTTGQKFDSSWDGGAPLEFGLNQVIPGWTEGLTGMKIGGRRVLVIPGELAYGATPPAGSGIEPNETLIFVVDLVDFR